MKHNFTYFLYIITVGTRYTNKLITEAKMLPIAERHPM